MKISVQDGRAALVKEDTLICGSDRSYVAEFEFDESWDGYDKTVIFEAGAVMKSVELADDVCDIPSDCFEKAGLVLKIGVYGTKNGRQTDTYWCYTSRILYEVEPIDIPTPGSGLPEVTASDNGDVLTVVNGAWDKAAPSGGDNTFFITPGAFNSDGGYYNVDKTVAEILDAVDSGKNVYLIEAGSGGPESGIVYYLPFMGGIRARVGSESIPTGALQEAYFWLTEAVVPGGSLDNSILQTRYTLALTYTDARLYKSTYNIVVPTN